MAEYSKESMGLGEVAHDERVPARSANTSQIPIIEPHTRAEHGAPIDHEVPPDSIVETGADLLWSRIRRSLREPFSEFFGVFILILFGDGVVAQVVLSGGTKGNYQSISWGWG